MKKTKLIKSILSLILAMIMAGSGFCFPITAEAGASDSLSWNVMEGATADFSVSTSGGGKTYWVKMTDAAEPYYQSQTTEGPLFVNDKNNSLIGLEMFSVEAQIKLGSYPSGEREGETADKKPLSLIAWLTANKSSGATVFNALRIDNNGYLHTANDGNGKTDIKLPLDEWVTLKCVFQPERGVAELNLNGQAIQKFAFSKTLASQYSSSSVRFFDGYFDWDAQIKGILVKSEHNYVIGEQKEMTADFIACQTTAVNDGRFDLRMISGIDSLNYQNVGYTVYRSYTENGEEVTTEQTVSSHKVYTKLNNGTPDGVKASDMGVKYFSAIVLKDMEVPTANDELLVIRPWAMKDGIRLYGTSQNIIISAGTTGGRPNVRRQTEPVYYEVIATEDTYSGGKYMSASVDGPHGDDELLNVKYDSSSTSPYNRTAYIKFELTAEHKELIAKAKKIRLEIHGKNFTLSASEMTAGGASAILSGVDTSWGEDNLKTSNASTVAAVRSVIGKVRYLPEFANSFDVTEYVVDNASLDAVAFSIAGDPDTSVSASLERPIYSKEYSGGIYAPRLVFVMSDYEPSHEIELTKQWNEGAEPWGYAEKLVSEWFADGGDRDLLYSETYTFASLSRPSGNAANGDYKTYNPIQSQSTEVRADGKTYVKYTAQASNAYVRTLADLSNYQQTVTTAYDKFGGITNLGVSGRATGFFHTETIGGKTHIIDPEGNPYYVLGVNTVNAGSTANQTEYLKKKYNSAEDFEQQFYTSLKSELKETFGLNTAVGVTMEGSLIFSDDSDGEGLSFVAGFSGISGYMGSLGLSVSLGGSSSFYYSDTMNVFDPDFVSYVDKSAKTTGSFRKDDPWLVGYTSDNELPGGSDMLTRYLTIDISDPVNAFSYAAAWTWLKAKTGKVYPTVADVTPEMQDEFMAFVYNRYFKVVSTAIKTYDPNHMYIGTRSHTPTYSKEGYLRAASRYVDVMTINLYGTQNYASINSYIENIQKYSNKPFIVSEFGMRALNGCTDLNDKPLGNHTGTACWLLENQQNRANSYESYVLNLIESGSCLGWVLYRFQDNDQSLWQDASGNVYALSSSLTASTPKYTNVDTGEVITGSEGLTKIHSGETDSSNLNHNKGIYDNKMEPYTEMATSMKKISDNLVSLINHFD